jgi:hypothetical protein
MSKVGADAISLGGLNYATDKLRGDDQASKATQEAADRLGALGTATSIGAGALTPTGVPQTLGRGLQIGGHALSGGVQSIIDAYTHGERDLTDLAIAGGTGSGISGVASGVGDVFSSLWGGKKARDAARADQTYKDAAELEAGKKAKYKEVDDANVFYKGRDARKLAAELRNIPLTSGYDKKAIKLRDEIIADYLRGDVSPAKLDKARQQIREMSTGKKRSVATGEKMIAGMDKFADTSKLYKPNVIGSIPAPDDVKHSLRMARDLHSRGERLGLVEQEVKRAERQGVAGRFNPFAPSPESATIKKFSKVAQDFEEGKSKGSFTKPEVAKIEKLEQGDFWRNLGGRAEPFSFRGKFGGPIMGLAATAGMIPGASQFVSAPVIAGAIGAETLSTLGQQRTKRQIEDLTSMIRDPAGKGIGGAKASPEEIAAAKEKLARLLGSAYRTTVRPEKDR